MTTILLNAIIKLNNVKFLVILTKQHFKYLYWFLKKSWHSEHFSFWSNQIYVVYNCHKLIYNPRPVFKKDKEAVEFIVEMDATTPLT